MNTSLLKGRQNETTNHGEQGTKIKRSQKGLQEQKPGSWSQNNGLCLKSREILDEKNISNSQMAIKFTCTFWAGFLQRRQGFEEKSTHYLDNQKIQKKGVAVVVKWCPVMSQLTSLAAAGVRKGERALRPPTPLTSLTRRVSQCYFLQELQRVSASHSAVR